MNRKNLHSVSAPGRPRQGGVALIVVLILLVLMTLLALVSLRGTLMQERMSSNQYDRSLAFQSAEAALREAEAIAGGKPLPSVAGGCDAVGICDTPVPTATPRWLDTVTNWNAMSVQATNTNLGTLAVTSRYIIEYMGEFVNPADCPTAGDPDSPCSANERHYLITARSQAAGRADVTLQTNFAVP